MHLQLVQVQTEDKARYLNNEFQRTLDINIFGCESSPISRNLR